MTSLESSIWIQLLAQVLQEPGNFAAARRPAVSARSIRSRRGCSQLDGTLLTSTQYAARLLIASMNSANSTGLQT